ncbi:hypothetical protein [Paludisphaera soli]|uniref:hypothetical protein n=1 Tax=Paludisphaera soli TaxID=2712865 RepID=UPI0013EA9341|nr:hypothetical protein [Paludisphaera soli]
MDDSGRPKMGRSWSRVAIATAALILAVSAGSESRAAGCHVPERPVLSRTTSWDAWANADPAGLAAPAALRPLPCEGETPYRAGLDAPAVPAAATTPAAPESPPASSSLRPADAPVAPRLASTPLDRPPRAA